MLQLKFSVIHRRSRSEDVFSTTSATYPTPSDKARKHAVTMCRQDPHYTPRTTNPFAALTQFHGVKKLFGNFSSCCELPSPFIVDTGESPLSLPGSPTVSRRMLVKVGSGTNLSDLPTSALRRRGSCESGFYSSVGECLSPNSLWDSGTAVSSIRSLEDLEPEMQVMCKRASSIYTDSNEDVSSVAGSDWTQENQLQQPNISTIVEYFERKVGGRRYPGSSKGVQMSTRIAALRRKLERQQNAGSVATLCPNAHTSPGTLQQRSKCSSRLVVCEGAVRSKLPLFDKK